MAVNVEDNGHAINAVVFRRELIAWGRVHFRAFPWRLTEDPYRILMAEIMLHRTRAAQVTPIYQRFIERYPNVQVLAQASKQELRDALSSLGLFWRIDLIHDMAIRLVTVFGGRIPEAKEELLSLPGVSDYIASALRCFAWNLPEPLVDTNTVRVIGRLFGLPVKDSSRRNRRFRNLLAALVDPHNPREYNYALLDLADHICMKKRAPECQDCPLKGLCLYGAHVQAERLRRM